MIHLSQITRADIWFFLVCLLTISFPWSERINSVFILFLCIFWLCDRNLPAKFRSLRQNWKLILPFWVFILLHILYLPRAMHFPDALQTIEVKLSFLLLPLLFGSENYLDEKNKKTLFRIFCYSCLLSVVYCIITYIIYFYPLLKWTKFFNRIYFSEYIMHPGYYSNFFVIAIIYISLELAENKGLTFTPKAGSLLFILIFLAVLFILVSQTAIIILILFSIFLMWKLLDKSGSRSIKYVLFAGFAIAIVLIFASVPSIRNRIGDTSSNLSKTDSTVQFANSTGSRIAAWGIEIDLIKKQWVRGYGTGNANRLLERKLVEGRYTDLVKYKMHTHNQIFHTWIDLGIAGILSLLIIFISCMVHFYKTGNTLGMWTVLLLGLYCITDDALEIQAITVFCLFVICILLFAKSKQATANPALIK